MRCDLETVSRREADPDLTAALEKVVAAIGAAVPEIETAVDLMATKVFRPEAIPGA
ncbi:hypothetical protein [Microvirga ossetica]|uniref:hypothetical protein n=1 Tax=Microvirga ossetica TaxID=1882682 RepID=UPI0012FFF0A0|nr:hypothetical protein [Microvirga ossetica]